MLKAIFMDYTGTLMREESQYTMALASIITENSSLNDIAEVFRIWWSLIKKYELSSYAENYLTEDEIVEKAFSELREEYRFAFDRAAFLGLVHQFWSKSPAFDDVKEFFAQCKLPVYMITNIDTKYVDVFMKDNGLQCAGIICGDMVKAYKPHREMFEKALEVSGCGAEEVLHIGDSMESDVKGALNVGIKACLLDRKGKMECKPEQNFMVCRSLRELNLTAM